MRKFSVVIPIAGQIYAEVEAENEKEAINKALDGDYKTEDIEEWQTYRKLHSGNVCHISTAWEAEAEDVGAADE
jgi:hypothetical protein